MFFFRDTKTCIRELSEQDVQLSDSYQGVRIKETCKALHINYVILVIAFPFALDDTPNNALYATYFYYSSGQ